MELISLQASLPYLRLFEQPGITTEKFFCYCDPRIRGARLALLQKLTISPQNLPKEFPKKSLAAKYTKWELSLRNSIAAVRASRRPDHGPAVRYEAGFEADAFLAVSQAYASDDPLQRERILDQARWNKISELEQQASYSGFSFDHLCAYRLKLQIAEKWTKRNEALSSANLDRTAESVKNGI